MEIVWVCLHNQGLPTTNSMAQQSGDSQGVTCGKLDVNVDILEIEVGFNRDNKVETVIGGPPLIIYDIWICWCFGFFFDVYGV